MSDQSRLPPFIPPTASQALMSLQATAGQQNTSPNYPPPVPTNPYAAPVQPVQNPTSVINLSHSSDVVIGPMTQYRGPVTIYQYMDATVESRAMSAGGGINQTRTKQSSKVLQTITDSSKLIIVLVFIVVIIIGLVAYFEITKPRFASAEGRKVILFGNDYNQGTFPNLGNGHLVIDREQWGASDQPINLTIKLEHPIPYVLITHVGVQNTPCFNVYKCSIKMRTIQDSSVAEKYLPDINSNFYVGNDGNVYVGRGWEYANTYANKSLAVTLIGDFIRYSPSETQFEAIQHLLSYGVAKSYLASDYKLVAQNQTKKTRSPGPTVYKEISKWPRWSPCGTDENNPPCGIEIGLPKTWDAKQ